MLRALVVLLLLANLAFWAWSTGALQAFGLAPASERDPQRLAQQIQPEAVRVLPAAAALAALSEARAASAASAPSSKGIAARGALMCLEAGPFTAARVEAAERALVAAAVPEGSWIRIDQDVSAQYAVVLGPFADRDAAKKASDELRRLELPFETLDLPADSAGAKPQPGLALGHYDGRSAADAALAIFSQRGVHSARSAVLRPAGSESRLRVDNATPALADRLRALSDPALGAGFAPCAAATAAR
jgi:hypothetical protein